MAAIVGGFPKEVRNSEGIVITPSQRGHWHGGRVTGFVFWFGWAVFIVFEKIILRMPWPLKHFVIGEFHDEFESQQHVLGLRRLVTDRR